MPGYVYDPWYLQQKPPVFCRCCLGTYQACYPQRRCCLFTGVAMWIIGIIMFITITVLCITFDCGYAWAIVISLAIFLFWLGYCVFHCAWAAHLLEDERGNMRLPTDNPDGGGPAEGGKPFQEMDELYNELEGKKAKTGFWQFAERDAWQAVSSRDRLQ